MTETKYVAWQMPLNVWGRLASIADTKHTTVGEVIKQSLTSIAATGKMPEPADIDTGQGGRAKPLSDVEPAIIRSYLRDGLTQQDTITRCHYRHGFAPTIRQVRLIAQNLKKEAA